MKDRLFLLFLFVLLICFSFVFSSSRKTKKEIKKERAVTEMKVRGYKEGFSVGYQAYAEQSGKYLPTPMPVPRHQNFEKGYEDGYHEATRAEHCPF
jgi:hypothetical protein